MAREDTPVRSIATTVLAALALVFALYFGRAFCVPILLSLVLVAVLWPLVQRLRVLRMSAPASASIVVVGCVVVLVVIGIALGGPLRNWASKAPDSIAAAQSKLQKVRTPFERISNLIAQTTSAGGGGRAGSAAPGPRQGAPRQGAGGGEARQPGAAPQSAAPPAPDPPSPVAGIVGRVFGTTTTLVGGAVEVLLLTLFLLGAGDDWRDKLLESTSSPAKQRRISSLVGDVRATVSRYLVVTALINIGQGIAVAIAMWLLGLPSPVLWGVLTFLAEFIPYLGGVFMMALLAIAALATFDSVARVVAAPGIYLIITTLQNNVVSPLAYGRGLRLNPTAILVAVLFWWYVWGVAGAFLAVPILAAAKIVSDQVEGLAPVARFLEG